MQTVKINGKDLTLDPTTGKVLSSNKNMETKVQGGGGGGYSRRGTGYSAPVRITSTTTVHDQLFLEDKEGTEHSFQLTHFDLACREGNLLTVIAAFKENKKTGPYIAVINHTTGKTYYNDPNLKRVGAPNFFIFAGILIVAVFLLVKIADESWPLPSFLLLIGLLIYYFVKTKQNINQIKAAIQPNQYTAQVVSV